jgi:hypothetical protein
MYFPNAPSAMLCACVGATWDAVPWCDGRWRDLGLLLHLLSSTRACGRRFRRLCPFGVRNEQPSARGVVKSLYDDIVSWSKRFSLYKAIRTHGPLYSSSIRLSQQDSLLYIQFSRTHPSSIHSIHYMTHLSLYLNISMCDLVLKDLLRRI